MRQRRPFLALLALLLVAAVVAAQRSATEWMNPLLGTDYAHWLVGPVAEIATADERKQFLRLTSDVDAEKFIDDFWSQRPEIHRLFEVRSGEADDRFSEAAYSGRYTDRGTILILYGEPSSISYEENRDVRDPDVELWKYAKGSNRGLDGKKPLKVYRFAKIGDLTQRFQKGGANDPAAERNRRPEPWRPPQGLPNP